MCQHSRGTILRRTTEMRVRSKTVCSIFWGNVGGIRVIQCLNRWCFFFGGYYLKLAFLGRILVNMHGVRNVDQISRECCSHFSTTRGYADGRPSLI